MARKVIMISLVILGFIAVAGKNVYATVPIINMIVPNYGPASGGTEVTIIGNNFAEGFTVSFGGVLATKVEFDSASGIKCISPGNTVGQVQIVVTNPDGLSATAQEMFDYKSVTTPVIIPPILPNEGHLSGNTSVTIKGANFTKGLTVTFGGIPATEIQVVSATEITCKSPKNEKKMADVVVTNPNEDSDICEQCYTYYTGCDQIERDALIDFYNNTNGKNWYDSTNWLGSVGTECTWKGITCDNEKTHITGVNLNNNHLEGKIPASIENLSELQIVSARTNSLSGQIPKELLNLVRLGDKQSDFRGNCLWTTDSDIRSFLNSKQIGGEWEGSQRSCCASDDISLTVRSIDPNAGVAGSNLEITLTGTGFDENTSVFMFRRDENGETVGDEKKITAVNVLSETEISLVLPVLSEVGKYSLKFSKEKVVCELPDAVMLDDPVAIEQQKRKKAIIVAGGGNYEGNVLWKATVTCTDKAYLTLIFQGYTPDSICYLSSERRDITGNGVLDVDGDATSDNLSDAISNWAKDAEEVLLYMTGYGGDGTFKLNATTEVLSAGLLDGWLDALQQNMPGKVIFVYDAGMSGSFLPLMTPPPEKKRIAIASSSASERAWFLDDGKISFSYSFWETLRLTGNLYSAFIAGKEIMKSDQTVVLDANGNGIGNENDEQKQIENDVIGRGHVAKTDLPHIGNVCEEQKLNCDKTSATLWVSDISFLNPIERVWAIIIPPDNLSGDPADPVLEMPFLDFEPNDTGVYEGTYENFIKTGTYKIAVYVKDLKGDQSMPVQTSVTQVCKGEVNGDKVVDLKDAIVVLKLLTGIQKEITIRSDYFDSNINVSEDKKIGLADVIYQLEKIAELMPN